MSADSPKYGYISKNLRNKMSKQERKWAAKFHAASTGYRSAVDDLNVSADQAAKTKQEVTREYDRRRRDVLNRSDLTPFLADVHYEVSISDHFEDIMIDLIDSSPKAKRPLLRAVEASPVNVGTKVIVRPMDHFYGGQSGSVIALRRDEFLIQIESKKVPVRTKSCDKNAPALVWLKRDDLKVVR